MSRRTGRVLPARLSYCFPIGRITPRSPQGNDHVFGRRGGYGDYSPYISVMSRRSARASDSESIPSFAPTRDLLMVRI